MASVAIAEQRLHRQAPVTTAAQSVGDLERRVRELQIRQRELEIENEQLRESRADLIDITERKQMEERLRISEERYRLLAQTAVDVIWTMNLEGKFTFVSPSVKELRGFTPEEVMQQTFEDIFTPVSLALVHEQFSRFLAELKAGLPLGTMRLELEHKCKDAIADYRYRCERRLSGLGMRVDWEIALSACPPLEQRTLLNVLRILQESLNNAVKHAQARQIRIAAGYHPDGELRIAVCDDGIGLPAVPTMGRGLANMRRRARDIGGLLDFTPLEPGTKVSLTLPLSPEPTPAS